MLVLVENLSFPSTPIGLSFEKLKSTIQRYFKPVRFVAMKCAKFTSLVCSEKKIYARLRASLAMLMTWRIT